MKIGDKIENALLGIDGTDIPVGAEVGYECGVDRREVSTIVRMREGKKVLCVKDNEHTFMHGQMGAMIIRALP